MASALIDASAVAEAVVWTLLGVGLVLVLVDRLRAGARPAAASAFDVPMAPGTEYALLAVVLTVGLALRLVGWSSQLTPAFWFSETATLQVDHLLRTGGLRPTLMRLLSETTVLGPTDAALVLPVLSAVQVLVGPRFGLPILSGALFGGLAVLLAWALGRRVRSQAFGLAFAAFVAVSPLEVTWSRLSGFCVAGGTHVLLALFVGWEAGRRGSVLLALVTGLVAWASVYHYYAARVAIPLALCAIVAGGQRVHRLRRALLLATLAVVAFLGVAYLAHGGRTLTVLWPAYGGYAGNKGERTLAQFVEQNVAMFQVELGHAVERFFARRRLGWDGDAWNRGLGQGGLVLLPVAALGLVGLASVLRRVRRQWLWLAFAAAGLALPALSVMTARRILVFDLAWCAFAAHGLLAAADTVGARFGPTGRARLATLVVVLVGAWSAAAVFLLSAALSKGFGQQIPFGDAGFGDGVACRRCLEAAVGWQRDMADGAFVVSFDNDVLRENRTSPGGLNAYGKIAALAANRPERFVEAYELMAGIDIEPPTPGLIFDRMQTTFVRQLTAVLERSAPTRIIWHFERPTAWERWLAWRLVAAGGTLETLPTPLSPQPGRRVITPWASRDAALAILREIGEGLETNDASPCVVLVQREAFGLATTVLELAADGPGDGSSPPGWLASGFNKARYESLVFDVPLAVGAWVRRGAGETATVGIFADDGRQLAYELPSLDSVVRPAIARRQYGLDCAAWADGRWWWLDPWTGVVASDHAAVSALPKGPWIGIAADPSGALVLAAADQKIVVWDPAARRERTRFPARVWPSVRQMPDECTPLAVGDGWIGSVDLRTSLLSVYDAGGRAVGTRRLDRLMRKPFPLTAVAGAGNHLAVASGTGVVDFEVRIAPACRDGGASPEP